MDAEKIVKYMTEIDIERRASWIGCAHKMDAIDELLNGAFQGLGSVDAKLIVEDKKILDGNVSNPFGDLSDHLTQSYLWILGAYEIIRTLSQFSDSGSSNPYSTDKEKIRSLKHEFELVRIPLAKYEAAKKNPNGYTFAYPILVPNHGAGWLIGQNQAVTRRDLSDKFLKLVEELP